MTVLQNCCQYYLERFEALVEIHYYQFLCFPNGLVSGMKTECRYVFCVLFEVFQKMPGRYKRKQGNGLVHCVQAEVVYCLNYPLQSRVRYGSAEHLVF